MRRAVLVEDRDGDYLAVGPVYTDASLDRLQIEVTQRGLAVRGTVLLVSAADFRAAGGVR